MNIKPNFLLDYIDYKFESTIYDGNIIGCHIDNFELLNKIINKKCKIVLETGDLGIVTIGNIIRIQSNKTFKKYIKLSKYIEVIFSNNVYNYNSKVVSIPLGTVNNLPQIDIKKKNLMYFNFNKNTHVEYRTNLCNFYNTINKTHEEYWNELSTYKTHLCPIGNGLDTYRIWEGYFYNTIPIHNIYFPYNLPHIYKNCLYKLDNIKEEYNKILNNWHNYNWSQLTKEYWIKKLYD